MRSPEPNGGWVIWWPVLWLYLPASTLCPPNDNLQTYFLNESCARASTVNALLGCSRTEGVTWSRGVCSFWTELVRSQLPPLHLLAVRVSCWCTLALKDNMWVYIIPSPASVIWHSRKNLWKLALFCTPQKLGREEVLVRYGSGHRLSGAGRVLMGSGAWFLWVTERSWSITWGAKSLEQVNFLKGA